MQLREELEKREITTLDPHASYAARTRGRLMNEEECDIRTCYMRDRDRIVHCKSFRRLKDKTQVFLAPQGDHYRTRMMHTLEVSQTSRTVARCLMLNEDLVEAIALGHDLGHTPFGHAGERALNDACPTGFRHSEQSLRIVDKLEKDGRGLNLTWEVRDGIRNHGTSCHPATLEGQIVRLCDKISYIHHDMDDAIRASGMGKVEMSSAIGEAMKDLRKFMFENLYTNAAAKGEETKAELMVRELYGYYISNPDKMPDDYYRMIEEKGEAPERVVCDYISGMTDQYSMMKFREIFIPQSWSKL